MSPKPKPETRWIFPELREQDVRHLADALGAQLPLARILIARGYTDPKVCRAFLSAPIAGLHPPLLMKDMPEAVSRIQKAIASKERILLYGDYDVDGTTSVVILKKALELAGADVHFFVPHRVKDGYGMRPEAIERAAADGVTLVISVDTGIRAGDVVRHARELGIDVIVTDHHLPEAELPPAVAVLNPNRPDCPYPEKNLCGAGVTFKLVQALMQGLGWAPERIAKLTESFLKMVALATVADVVPLTGENRIIVKRGLEGFDQVRNPGLKALLNVAGFEDGARPSAGQIAFRVAPRINAAGRMASANDVIELFTTNDPKRAQALASQLHDLNKDRQETEAEIIRLVEEECTRTPVGDCDWALVFSAKGWHKGVVGIVASRIVERYHRPVFILSEDEESGLASGSGRSISAFHLLEALESMHDLFTKFGGHRQAAGLTIPTEMVPVFRDRLNAYAQSVLSPSDLCPSIELDAVMEVGELNDPAAAEILSLAPFGCGNPGPRIAMLGVEIVEEPIVRKEKLVQLTVEQNNRRIKVKAWNLVDKVPFLTPGTIVDLALCIEEDQQSAALGYRGWGAWIREIRFQTT